MEGGDIEQVVSSRSVVTLAPTLVSLRYPGHPKLLPLQRRLTRTLETIEFNVMMLRWIESVAYRHSKAFEVWHIAPHSEFHDLLFERIVAQLDDYARRGVSSWEHYDEDTATQILLGSPHIDVIYDGDHDRVERCWRYRGYRVPAKGTP